jgi:hypothetical protein
VIQFVILQDELFLAIVIDIERIGMGLIVFMSHPEGRFGNNRGMATVACQRPHPRARLRMSGSIGAEP